MPEQQLEKGVFLDSSTLGQDISLQCLNEHCEFVFYDETPYEEHIIYERIKDAQIVITNKVPLTKNLLKQATKLQLICISATGTDHIDLEAAQEHNILVCNVQNYATSSVAQHTLAMILNLATQMHHYHQDVLDKHWSRQNLFCLLHRPIIDLENQTLGIIGYGTLGRAVAQRAKAFGMNIMVCENPWLRSSNADKDTPRVPLSQLLETSDFISLHCPLTTSNRGFVNKEFFQKMKSSAHLINTARGALVDTSDLCWALDNNIIAGAALDVYDQEPLKENHPLVVSPRDNLLLTPHTAWASKTARELLVKALESNIQAYKNKTPKNLVI